MSECSMCSGEYCAGHGVQPCNCDTADRHGPYPCGHTRNREAVPVPTPNDAPAPAADGAGPAPTWHAGAGRKGARRIHQLIEKGRLYERERGLKPGRQRLRQLIELGKRYEQEHGEAAPERKRKRLRKGDRQRALAELLRLLVGIALPSVRDELERMIGLLEGKAGQAEGSESPV